MGLHFEDVEQASGAPVEVAFVEVKPVGVENKATVKFTMPTVDTDGGDLTGKTLNYRIADSTGANNLATGTAEAGTDVTAEVNVSQAGETTVIVYTSLNDVESRGTSGKGFIGPDTPVIAAKPNVRINGQQATISWTAAVPYNNGNLGEPINYVVTRMPDNYTVGTTTELTITDNIASEYKVGYTYKVMPKYTVNGTDYTGDAVESRVSYIGKYLELPFYETFDNEDRFLSYEAVDGNGDGNYWEFNAYREAADYTGTSYDANDDLLIGPFKMQAGSTYTFKMQADGFSVAERVAVYAGTRENLTTEIVPDTRIYPTVAMLNVNEQFAPEADGDYYFDIRALSDANSQHLYIYEVSVEEMAGNLPAAPSDLKVIPASDTATIHFRLPSTTINGEELTSLSYAFLYRNGDCIKTITTDVNPGAEMDVVDEEYVEDGSYTYSVTAMNDAGEGLAAEITVFRGADIPGKVRNLNIYEDVNTSGLLHITFDAPEAGYRGGYVDPENVEYTFDYITMSNGSNTVNLGKGTTHTYQLPAAVTKQDILAGSITATNNIGDAREWVTSICTVGPALDLPLLESWAGMSQSSGLWPAMNLDEDAELYESMWDISDGAVTDIKPYDADGGMLAFATEKNGGGYRTFTPRVSLDGAANPTLVFYYNYTEKATEFNVEILVEDQPLTSVQAIDLDAAEANTWQRCEIPLKDYVGKKYVQLAFSARGNVGKGIVAIDNLSVTDYLNKDLSVTSFTAPKRADVNSEIEFTATVRNNGADLIARGDYNVQLFKNGSVITELQGVDLAGSSEHQFTLTDTPTAADPEMSEYYVAVIYEDGNQENNISQVSTVHIVSLNLPVVTDLKALNGEAVTLSWTAPTASDIPGASTIESFEDYNPFIIDNIGNWTLYDGDGMDTAILAFSTGVLDYEHIGEKMAWQVIDPIEAGIPLESWMPRTGDKMLVSFQACLGGYRDVDSEDWLISPRLDGSEQTITFYARTAARDYSPELFDFKISSDNNATSSFNTLEEDVAVNYDAEDWTEFSFQVPEGTRHFAIVHKSNNQLAMLIDDITYIADGSEPMDIKLQGFNVYRNGVKLNDNPVAAAENSYVDSNVADGEEYTYGVTAVWDKGESAMSETVTITVSGVEGVTTHELRISGRQNAILVEGGLGEQIDVYTIDGMRVASAIAQGETMIPVAANGIYVVKAGNSVAKIVVH